MTDALDELSSPPPVVVPMLGTQEGAGNEPTAVIEEHCEPQLGLDVPDLGLYALEDGRWILTR
jgi:hypothetical protein